MLNAHFRANILARKQEHRRSVGLCRPLSQVSIADKRNMHIIAAFVAVMSMYYV